MRYTSLMLLTIVAPFCSASNDYEKAHDAFNASKVEEAYIHLKNSLKNSPNDLPSQLLMAKILLQQHHYNDSASLYQEALNNGADINLVLNEFANALMLSKEYGQVIALNDSGKLNSTNYLQWLLLAANAYKALDDIEKANLYLQQAEVIAPDNLNVLHSLAINLLQQTKYTAANKKITHALSLYPENAKNWYLQGQFYITQLQYKQALLAFEQAYELAPSDPFTQRALANIYTSENRIPEALTLVNLVLKDNPNDPFALLLKSRLLSSNNQEKESRLILEDIANRLSLLSDEDKKSNLSLLYVASVSAYVKGDFELAQTQLQTYLKEKGDDLFAINLLVSIYRSQGQWSKAQATLENNILLIKDDLQLTLQLVEIYLQNNQLFKAEQMLSNLPIRFQSTVDYLSTKALLLNRNSQTAQALRLIDDSLLEKKSPKLLITKALILKESNNIPAAMNIVNNLLISEPNNSDYLKLKSALLLVDDKRSEALAVIEKILTLKPNDYTSLFNKASSLAAMNQLNTALAISNALQLRTPEASQIMILQAKINRDLGNTAIAIEILDELVRKEKTNIAALEALLYIHIDQKNNIEAMSLLDQLTKLSFLNPKYVRLKSQVYRALNDDDNSRKQIQILSSLAKSSEDFYVLAELQANANMLSESKFSLEEALSTAKAGSNDKLSIEIALVNINLKMQNYATSGELLKTIEQQYPNSSLVALLHGHYYHIQQQFLSAQQYYQKALVLDKENSQALIKLYQLAQNNIKKNEFTKTVVALLNEFPENYLARNLLADNYLNNGELLAAKPHYEKLAQVEFLKNRAAIFNNLANIIQGDDLEQAKSYAKRAVEINPTSAAFLDTYGWVTAQQGDYDSALNLLRNAYAMDSNNPSISYHLAFTLTKLKRNQEALSTVKQSLKNRASFSELEQAKQLLEKLLELQNQSSS
ncbi:PEP-CTERM system TPR-repeat protein PrsT [Colwellia sp. Arc7-635]|uniref:XrtA/PEP-CTERM system TPR-repeat protein PrsT n=1 Tax=Colwellia sp. Arc7-635 TaxID=2497879 RepID=UPI000F8558FE|nr:XrtA/PEP-CTERM system TPR-repeat protein PrsT [Colwellia sp. Arc7-635]AZQ84689.1 PEP-CTERM system TPR-repeat protein PrsT [Colwellia sp. Arc7-635]